MPTGDTVDGVGVGEETEMFVGCGVPEGPVVGAGMERYLESMCGMGMVGVGVSLMWMRSSWSMLVGLELMRWMMMKSACR